LHDRLTSDGSADFTYVDDGILITGERNQGVVPWYPSRSLRSGPVVFPRDRKRGHQASKPYCNRGGHDQFEEIVLAIEEEGLRDILVHPNQRRYPGQVVLVVSFRDYVFLVPSVEEDTYYFLKTIIPSRKATRDYLETDESDEET